MEQLNEGPTQGTRSNTVTQAKFSALQKQVKEVVESQVPALQTFVQDELKAIKGAAHKSSQGDGDRQYTMSGLSTNLLYVKRRLKEVETM